MLISHKYKAIFIKTTKTGGSSFEFAFRKFMDGKDIVVPMGHNEELRKAGLVEKANVAVPLSYYNIVDWYKLFSRAETKKYREHMTAQEVKGTINSKIWDNYFKFCIERNPLEKVKSRYYWTGIKTGLSLNDYAVQNSHIDSDSFRYSSRGKVIVDKVYKYEEMNLWLPELQKKLGLPDKIDMKSVKLKSGYRPKVAKVDKFSEEALTAIRCNFAREIMHFYSELK